MGQLIWQLWHMSQMLFNYHSIIIFYWIIEQYFAGDGLCFFPNDRGSFNVLATYPTQDHLELIPPKEKNGKHMRNIQFRTCFPLLAAILRGREELSWMNSSFSRKVMPKVDVVMVAKCPGVDAIEAVPFKHLWRSVEQLDAALMDLPSSSLAIGNCHV